MVICGSYVFEFSASRDMEKTLSTQANEKLASVIPKIKSLVKSMLHMKRSDSRKDSRTFMSNTYCQEIENWC